MKKIMFVMMAAMAVCFTSCGNKTQQPAAEVVEDTVQAVDVEAAFTDAAAQLASSSRFWRPLRLRFLRF